MTNGQLKLTAELCKSLPVPGDGFAEYQDMAVPHLFFRISSKDRRGWHYRAFQRGKTRREALGSFPGVPPAAARDAVRLLDMDWGTGAATVAAASRRTSYGTTLGDVWMQYMEAGASMFRPKTLVEKESCWRLHLAAWSGRLVESITRADVAGLHARIGAQHPVTANRVLKCFRACMHWAVDTGLCTVDPSQGVRKHREKERTRFLLPAERERFLKALDASNRDLRHYVVLSLATGARQRDVLAMRWDDIDLEAGLWILRQSKTDNHMTIPLVDDAAAILAERRETIEGEYVFPGRKGSDCPHIGSFKKSWAELRTRAKTPDLHMHDLRRTLGSWMAIQGSSQAIIGQALGHRDSASTAIYARLMADPVTAAMIQAAGDILERQPEDPPERA